MRRGRPLKGSAPQSVETGAELIALWNRALIAPHGIAIRSEKPALLQAKLYAARRNYALDTFNHFRVVALEDEVRIIPRGDQSCVDKSDKL